MRTFTTALGESEAVIFAPEPGTFSRDDFLADFPPGQVYGLDVESTGLDIFSTTYRLRLVQFGTIGYAWVLNMEDPAQREAAIELLSNTNTHFCSHTNIDVLSVYTQLGVDITARNWDTHMLATMAAPDEMDGGKGLKDLATQHGMPQVSEGETVLKAVFRSIWNAYVAEQRAQGVKGLSVCNTGSRKDVESYGWVNVPADCEEYLVYAGLDAVAARRLLDILIPQSGAPAHLLKTEQWLAGAANRLQLRGALVDRAVLDELHAEAVAYTEAANEEVNRLCGLNVTQGVKLREWFGQQGVDFSQWAEHGGEITKNGGVSLAKKNIFVLKTFELTPVAELVTDAMIRAQQHADARMKTQGVLDALCPDGRVRSKLLTVGTVTGRMASQGPNMQNFSKKDQRVRGMFIPAPGEVMISCDFSQVELRVAAALAGEESMIEAIKRGDDLHQLTADKLGITRDLAKTVNFLILYGGGPKRLAAGTGKPYGECIEVIEAFWDAYPAIAAYNREMMTLKNGVRTISYRYVPVGYYIDEARGIKNAKLYKNLNSQIQSSARDLIVDAWWRLEHEFGMGDLVWGLIHDEMIVCCKDTPEEIDRTLAALQECMTMDFLGVPIEAQAEVLRDETGVSRWKK